MESATQEELENTPIPTDGTDELQEAAFQLVATSFMLGLIHAAEEEPGAQLSDDVIEPVPFAEAVKYLSAKIPLTKKEWEKLEPKIRFRAFTAALLGQAHEIEAAKKILVKSLEEGTGYGDTWYQLKQQVAAGESLSPGYWENVYRTNTQSAYVAGKLEQYQGSGVAAYQLMVIEDSRTTAICRNLLSKASGYGAVIPVNDKFWKQHGFPPYHYQCRTSIRGIWPSQLRGGTKADTTKTAPAIKDFEPMAGFGGNPAQDGLWWQETASQRKQAAAYGVQELIEAAREKLVEKTKGAAKELHPSEQWEEKAKGVYVAKARMPKNKQQKAIFNKEFEMAKIAADNGHVVYMLPETSNGKNPDVVMDGVLTEFKEVTGGENAISHRFRESLKQGGNSFLKIDKEITSKRVKEILKGVIKDKNYKGTIYCYLAKEKQFYSWKREDL